MFAVRATPIVMTLDSGAERVITVLSPWTTVIGLLGVSERVRGGGETVSV